MPRQEEAPELDPDEWARARPETMCATLEWIDETWGSLNTYFDCIGFDAWWRSQLRKTMLQVAPRGSSTEPSEVSGSTYLPEGE